MTLSITATLGITVRGKMTLSITASSIRALRGMLLNITTIRIMTLSIEPFLKGVAH
jgi:hypothetical protein